LPAFDVKIQVMSKRHSSNEQIRVFLALLLPLAGAATGGLLASARGGPAVSSLAVVASALAAAGLVSWFLGLRWYGLPRMGLRGGRPLFAGIGFAFLAWFVFILLRFLLVEILGFGPPQSGRAYVYLLLFEAFALQLWTFGLLFRAIADWRGPLTAAISSGLFFGIVAGLFFQEAYIINSLSLIYFLMWGIVYGIIRLRTGSILGTLVVQSLHSFTSWVVMAPLAEPDPGQLQNLYVAAAIAYLVIIWRLWPKRVEDYRV